jgi:hypothetical protein
MSLLPPEEEALKGANALPGDSDVMESWRPIEVGDWPVEDIDWR